MKSKCCKINSLRYSRIDILNQNGIDPIVPAAAVARELERELERDKGHGERGHDACEQNQDLGIASKDKKKARSCRFCCALLLRRLCSLMQTSSLCNEVVTLVRQCLGFKSCFSTLLLLLQLLLL